MTEIQLKEYQDYLIKRTKSLQNHINNLDTEENEVTCSCLDTILDDMKHIISCIHVQNNPAIKKGVVNQ